ncbi:hypothetical protein A2230_02420 [candidate division WOR-1 bacterium RIFOXYA2_FULL_36_21]|uniref:HEPN domain-containing protein n=1 Tax=candidate division WOR-1 bacterium RIFOXYB2_FULL_36_35 TaxID=1802578 RepID=A0A1F4S5T2_UNCSA|nr:MAG: hypothetical protein A2230_02420 [candidate division WOR-1 bacterium RIFOXYA2_FULL_36_21]OGC15796.1 MAG: hypothetical protein A2290_05605 [candidate division WOR-1 bacterium RIFOXYB2_FULL_36_35]
MKSKASNVVLEWIKRADSDSDFYFAKVFLKEFNDFYSQMCLLCHDAVEKYLKAYLIFKNIKYKKIHDLVVLLKDCAKFSDKDQEFLKHEDACRILNNYYIPLKYPSHYPLAKHDQAKEAVGLTEQLSVFIKNKILN